MLARTVPYPRPGQKKIRTRGQPEILAFPYRPTTIYSLPPITTHFLDLVFISLSLNTSRE